MEDIIALEGSYLHELAHGNRSNPCYLVSSDLVFLVVCFDTHPTECFLYLHIVHRNRLVNYFKPITWRNLHNMNSKTSLAWMNSTLTRSLSVRGREASRKLRNSSTNWTTVTGLKKDVADISEKWSADHQINKARTHCNRKTVTVTDRGGERSTYIEWQPHLGWT